MELVGIVRKNLGLSIAEMSRKLQKKTIQGYIKLERTNTKITLPDLIRLQRASKLSPADFWALLVKSTKGGK
jgi:hypothetical protein